MCIDDKFSKPVVLYRGKKNGVYRFIKTILKVWLLLGGDKKAF